MNPHDALSTPEITNWAHNNLQQGRILEVEQLLRRGELESAHHLVSTPLLEDEKVEQYKYTLLQQHVNRVYEQIQGWQQHYSKPFMLEEPKSLGDIPRFNYALHRIQQELDATVAHPAYYTSPNSFNALYRYADGGGYTGYFAHHVVAAFPPVREVPVQGTILYPIIEAHCLDVQHSAMEVMKHRPSNGVKYHKHNVEQPWPINDLDCITLLELLTHTLNAGAALDASLDALKPGGLLLCTVSTPTNERWFDLERLRSFTEVQLLRLFDRAAGRGHIEHVLPFIGHASRNVPELLVSYRKG